MLPPPDLADAPPPRPALVAPAAVAPAAPAAVSLVAPAGAAPAPVAPAAPAPVARAAVAPAAPAAPAPVAPIAPAAPAPVARAAPAPPVARDGPRWGPPVAHSLTLMTGTRLAEAYLYPEPFARVDLGFWGERYRDAFTKPPLFDASKPAFRWDGDPVVINVVGHGLMGSEYYLRARACRFSPWGALAFTAGASAVWEYAFEANGVRPSGLDLVYTPLAGLAFGEARYQAWRAAAGLSSPGWRAVVRAAVDPFGELERGVGLVSC